MSLAKAIGIGFLVLILLGLALAVINYMNQPPQPYLAMNIPSGFTYNGPDTSALAAWYCIASINSSNGYSIQLNAELGNGEWVQDSYIVPPNGQSGFNVNVWSSSTSSVTAKFVPANANCAWLVITIKGGYANVGYSLDGKNVIWYASYPVGATYIIPDASGQTNLVVAGFAYGLQAQLGRGTLVYLALYYWNGTDWAPASIKTIQGLEGTLETVNHAWIFTRGSCGGYVAWFGWNKTDWTTPVLPSNLEPICPTPPSFKP
jgi:hypothetical protein